VVERIASPKASWTHWRLPFVRKGGPARPRGLITAIDIEGDTLRVVQTHQRHGRIRVSRVAVEQLGLGDNAQQPEADALGRAIARALNRLRIKPGPVVMGLPRALVVLRTLSVPAIENLRELASLVHFQIAKDLPFRLEDAVIDFKIRRPDAAADRSAEDAAGGKAAEAQPKQEVLVAAAKREVVEFYQQAAAAAGLKLLALGFRPYANARCIEACRVYEGHESVGFVSLRPDEVLVDVIAQQDLVFSRGVSTRLNPETVATAYVTDSQMSDVNWGPEAREPNPVPAPPSTDPQQSVLEEITIEVVRSFHSFGGMEVKNPVARLVVAGATGHEARVVEALQKRLNIPCALLEPARAMDLPLDARGYASGAIAALGLGLGVFDPQGLPFDFLNPKQPAVQRDTRRIKIVSAAAAAALLALVVGSIEFRLLRTKNLERDRLDAQLQIENGRRDVYRRVRTQASGIQNWLDAGQNWLDHYAYLSTVLPSCEEVYVTGLSVSGQGTISLGVQARSGEVLAKLEKQLSAAGYEVQPLAIKPGKDRHDYPFRSSIELLVPSSLKIDLTKLAPPSRPADDGSLDKPKRGGS
jgi:Tfp pilus assembly PilM family ATPase